MLPACAGAWLAHSISSMFMDFLYVDVLQLAIFRYKGEKAISFRPVTL